MDRRGSEPDSTSRADEGAIFEAYVDQLLGGNGPTPDTLFEQHPGASRELRQRVRALWEIRRRGEARTAEAHGSELPFDTLGDFRLLRRLSAGGMGAVYEAEQESLGRVVARSHLSDRRAHWSALKRKSGDLLRLTSSSDATTDPRAVSEPPPSATGPSTFASRREQLVLAVRALAVLLERDRRIVRAHCEGLTISELAESLGLGYDAARIANTRALERFRKSYALLLRASGSMRA